jgi:serine/threonine protein phosphatase PrpC
MGMGTTATALILRGAEAYVAHVGDSRLYRCWENGIDLLTRDDTVVMDMVRDGLIEREEARHHPEKHVLARALGTRGDLSVTPARIAQRVQIGDNFILCTDGLFETVEDKEIWTAATTLAPDKACRNLVALANERDGLDNISVGILAIRPVQRAESFAPRTREVVPTA